MLLKNVYYLVNKVDSAGDRLKDIRNKPYETTLMYLINFEIWGSYKSWANKGLLARREAALASLGHLTNESYYEIQVSYFLFLTILKQH
jgi:hypothetical protein